MVNLLNFPLEDYISYTRGRKVYAFAASDYLSGVAIDEIASNIAALVDNDPNRWGNTMNIDGRDIKIISPDELINRITTQDVILISSNGRHHQILEQIDNVEVLDGIDCFILMLMLAEDFKPCTDDVIERIIASRTSDERIPRKIHYTWFGGGKMSDINKAYIEGWQRLNPDYEVIRWDESNCDIDKYEFTHKAYQQGMYVRVSSIFRLDIIYNHGGVFFDPDVELIKPLDDFLCHDAFFSYAPDSLIETGSGFGAVQGHKIINGMFDFYDDVDLCEEGQKRRRFTARDPIADYGFKYDGKFSCIDDVAIYPREFFSPYSAFTGKMHMTVNTCAVHHFEGNWLNGKIGDSGARHNLDIMRRIDL